MIPTRSSLLLRIRRSDDSVAWLEFDRLYRPLMYRYARARGVSHEDAEDVVQQCMTAVTRHIGEFAYCRERGGFKNWLRTVVDNAVKNHFRKKSPPRAKTERLAAAPARDASPAELWETHWEQEHLLYCLEQCRAEVVPRTFEAFRLYVLEQWAPERVAEHLSLSVDKVYRAKSRVLRRVRQRMGEILADLEVIPDGQLPARI
jgi:RNA polymerase sigma-70 factor (ECF subfamily)